jgi:uncharacterized protein YjbI with pentapeptide repeats
MTEVMLNGATLSGADLTHANLTGGDLTDAELVGTILDDANLEDVEGYEPDDDDY